MNPTKVLEAELRELEDERDGLRILMNAKSMDCHVYNTVQQVLEQNRSRMNTIAYELSQVNLQDQTRRLIDMQTAWIPATQTKQCPACGMALRTRTVGRSKYCAYCGCYIPKILYD